MLTTHHRKTIENHPLITKGMRLLYDLEDFDARDRVLFTICATTDDLELDVTFVGHDTKLRITAEALESATAWLHLAQGDIQPTDGRDKKLSKPLTANLPPFLLGRASLRTLRETAKRRTIQATVSGAELTLDVLVAKGGEGELWVLDDDRYPIVVKRTWDDECSFELLAAGLDVTEKTDVKKHRFSRLAAERAATRTL